MGFFPLEFLLRQMSLQIFVHEMPGKNVLKFELEPKYLEVKLCYFNIWDKSIWHFWLKIFFSLLSRNKIDLQPGQNVLKLIQDCFESKLLFGVLLDLLTKENNYFLPWVIFSGKYIEIKNRDKIDKNRTSQSF